MAELVLPRPVSQPGEGPLDGKFWDLVESDFRRAIVRHPMMATFLGIHDHDHLLDDGTRDGVEQDI